MDKEKGVIFQSLKVAMIQLQKIECRPSNIELRPVALYSDCYILKERKMKTTFVVTVIAFIAALTTGCTPPNIQSIKMPSGNEAGTITVFRPDVSFNMGNEMIVAIDNIEVATLLNKQYISVKVEPGEHNVSVRASAGSDSSLLTKVAPSSNLYFEAAGSSNNAVNFIPGTYLFKSNFYIEKSDGFDNSEYTKKDVTYN